MLSQFSHTIEQLDLAAEHLSHGDANNARFALMLSDNVVELTLHQLAKDTQSRVKANAWMREPYEHEKPLAKALGRWFEEKVRFAVLLGKLSPEIGESIRVNHLFRNDIYHVGLQHEAILPALATFYYDLACQLCADYEVRSWGYSPGQKLPDRAAKYMKGERSLIFDFPGEYRKACLALKAKSAHEPIAFAEALASHMDSVVEQHDKWIDYISRNAPRRESRDQVVIGCQSWPLLFTEEGRDFCRKNGFKKGNLVTWLEEHYPFKFKSDPIPAWRKRAERLRREKNAHTALKMYRSFMDDTADLRDALGDATSAVDNYVEEQIERMREARASTRERGS